MLASKDLIYVPQGRAAPLAFDRADGSPRGAMGEAGGVFLHSIGGRDPAGRTAASKRERQRIRIADIRSKQPIASFSGTNRILVAGDLAWLSIDGKTEAAGSGKLRRSPGCDRSGGEQTESRRVNRLLSSWRKLKLPNKSSWDHGSGR